MLAVDVMRTRLAGAGSLADTPASGWDAFELMRAVTIGWPVVDDRLFAAFMLASASAATGRDAVGLAPCASAPVGPETVDRATDLDLHGGHP